MDGKRVSGAREFEGNELAGYANTPCDIVKYLMGHEPKNIIM